MIGKHKSKIAVVLIIIFSLILAFFQGEEKSEYKIQPEEKAGVVLKKEDVPEEIPASFSDNEIKTQEHTKEIEVSKTEEIEKIEENEPKIIEKDIPIEDEKESNNDLNCTLSIKCDTIIKNSQKLIPEKLGIIPADGIIFEEQTVVFYEGETVFNLLVREMKKNKIHMEFVKTPVYKSAYIEGIANIYEKDCGDNSGWIYRVNGITPGYGCSEYKLREGDEVEWIYSCDLGRDIGG